MNPKIYGYAGIGILVLVLISGILWQANKLIRVGEKLGQAKAVEKELRDTLKKERNKHNGQVTSLNTIIENCKFDLGEEIKLSTAYREEVEKLKLIPPKRETIVLESTNCTDGLVEAHMKAIRRMEVARETPHPN